MMTKPGRNDPCPCGSGKKYKKCCLPKEASPVSSLTWQKMRKTEGELIPILLEYAIKHYGQEAPAEAWEEMTIWRDAPMDPDAEPELDSVFPPWFVFNWIPDNTGVDKAHHFPEMPVAIHYLQRKGAQLDSFQRRYIEEICSQPYSFFVVTDVVPGKQMTLEDLLLRHEVTVHERQATMTLREGAIIYSRVITMDNDSVMVGCGPTVIPAKYRFRFIDLREDLVGRMGIDLNRDMLHAYATKLREIYYDIREQIRSPALPEMRNTDGDPLQPTKLHYLLNCTPAEALEALATLSLSGADDLMQEGLFDRHGELQRIQFPWLKNGNTQHAGWNNTVLGQISIDKNELIIEVNSQQRAEAVKRKITRRLGKRAAFRHAVIQSMAKMFEEAQNTPHCSSPSTNQESEDLMALPEIQAQIQEMAKQHWKKWLDTELPALKGQTPRQAAKTAFGRERLEALFAQFAQHDESPQPFDPDIAALRRSLGMD